MKAAMPINNYAALRDGKQRQIASSELGNGTRALPPAQLAPVRHALEKTDSSGP